VDRLKPRLRGWASEELRRTTRRAGNNVVAQEGSDAHLARYVPADLRGGNVDHRHSIATSGPLRPRLRSGSARAPLVAHSMASEIVIGQWQTRFEAPTVAN
jgi:hypothetical protein